MFLTHLKVGPGTGGVGGIGGKFIVSVIDIVAGVAVRKVVHLVWFHCR